MIGRLHGRVVAQEADGGVVVDVAGVGYDVTVPLGTLGRVREDETGRVTLWVHTHVREDALALYGFADELERATFRALLGVANVGPKIAVAVLGALPAAELSRAVARQDLAALKGIKGVGPKLAERFLLELRDKLPQVAPTAGAGPAPVPSARRGTPGEERLRTALTGLGFKPSEADRAVAAIGERADSAPDAALIKEALAILAR